MDKKFLRTFAMALAVAWIGLEDASAASCIPGSKPNDAGYCSIWNATGHGGDSCESHLPDSGPNEPYCAPTTYTSFEPANRRVSVSYLMAERSNSTGVTWMATVNKRRSKVTAGAHTCDQLAVRSLERATVLRKRMCSILDVCVI